MGMYKYVRDAWKKPGKTLSEVNKQRYIDWAKELVTVRIERPTRIDRARSLGYRAKQGIFVVRQRLIRGKRMREKIRKGRRPKHSRQKKVLDMNYQQVAEQRANRGFPNCEVLNSYTVGKTGRHCWFEVILVDRAHPAIITDKQLSFMTKGKHRGRAYRGLTSAGNKSRQK